MSRELAAGRRRVEDELRRLQESLRSTLGVAPGGSLLAPLLGIALGVGLGLLVRSWLGRAGRRP